MQSALALDFMDITGTLPSSLGQLTQLAYQLWIQDTLLTGTLPSELHQLTSLAGMYISGNYFTGEVQASPLASSSTQGQTAIRSHSH